MTAYRRLHVQDISPGELWDTIDAEIRSNWKFMHKYRKLLRELGPGSDLNIRIARELSNTFQEKLLLLLNLRKAADGREMTL